MRHVHTNVHIINTSRIEFYHPQVIILDFNKKNKGLLKPIDLN